MVFLKVKGCQSLKKWLKGIDNVVRDRNSRSALNVKLKGRAGIGYTDWITRVHPMYMDEMFRQAASFLGDATFDGTAATMNLQSTGLEVLPQLTLNNRSLYR